MQIQTDITVPSHNLPTPEDFQRWATAAIKTANKREGDVAIRIVTIAEIQQLNRDYRHKDKPTNVLSFPFDMPEGIEGIDPILGDIAICADIVAQEAAAQQKKPQDHWAHMVVHGCLHLLGYDHIKDDEAEEMEALEIAILTQFGITTPY